jgi:hypothetical protein
VRQYQQPQQQTYVYNYRPPWQQQQQQHQQRQQQARYIQPQRLPVIFTLSSILLPLAISFFKQFKEIQKNKKKKKGGRS